MPHASYWNAIDIALEASAEPDAQTQICIVRDAAWAAQPCRQAVSTAFSIRGGSASLIDEPLQRSWRDVNAGANHARLNWEDFTKMWGSYRIRQYATQHTIKLVTKVGKTSTGLPREPIQFYASDFDIVFY